MEEYTITIKGFKTKAQAEAFYEWYEGQGEQSIPIWLENDEALNTKYMDVDMQQKKQWDGNNLTFTLEMTPTHENN